MAHHAVARPDGASAARPPCGSCRRAAPPAAASSLLAQGNSPWTPPRNNPVNAVQPITAAEYEALVFLREEEKLARDVYRALFEQWKLTDFDRIASSEEAHFNAIGNLLNGSLNHQEAFETNLEAACLNQ